MHLSELCIHRPIMTTLLSTAIVLLGVYAYRFIPIAALPSFDTPVISVSATLPGASAEIMAATVANPLEKQFASISGLKTMVSTSNPGKTAITLEFESKRDIDAAALDVQAALLRAQRSLPDDMTVPPSYQKVNPANQPILLIGISSPALGLADLNDYAENWIAPNLTTLDGVAQVNIYGQKRFAVRVLVDPDKLAQRQLSLLEVEQAINRANSNTAVGKLEGYRQKLDIEANKQLRQASEFAQLSIVTRNGIPIKLADIAKVSDSVETVNTSSWINGKRGILLAILRQSDANTVDVVDQIRARLPQLQRQLPSSLQIAVFNDRSESIREAIRDVNFSLALTVVLVIMVIFLFLRQLTATLIPTVALPISLISTFALMAWLGHSLNNVSLLGITLAVGLVVDDAIVVLENISRHLEKGKSAWQAAIEGAKEVSFTIVSISLSLVAVFIPIFYMPGVIGLLFHEFAVVVSLAILVSAIASLTVIPMLCSKLLRHQPQSASSKVAINAYFDSAFQRLRNTYATMLDWSLQHRNAMLGLTVASFILSLWLAYTIPKGFFPEEDIGQISVNTEANLDIAYTAMLALHQQVAAKLSAHPAVASVLAGVGGIVNSNNSRFFITLKPRSQRPPIAKVIEQMRRDVSTVIGIKVYFNPIQNLQIGSRATKSRYQIILQSLQSESLNDWSEQFLAALRQESMLRDVNSDAQRNGLQASLRIDRDRAATLGVDMQTLRDTLYSAFGDRQISTIYTAAAAYPVIIQLDDRWRDNESAFDAIKLRNNRGQLTPLNSFTRVQRSAAPTAVNHQSQLPSVTLSFNLAPGVTLGEALARINTIQHQLAIPDNISSSLGGDAAVFQQSQRNQWVLLLLAIAVIYLLLGILYESYIHPITILAGIPSAAVGALITLRLFNLELTIIAVIGILLLIGIVKKNAIMMIDFAIDAQRQQQIDATTAIRQACLLRLRPIMMTTLAAAMGAVPIAAGWGASAELRQPLGLVVVGGLVFSQMITLFITPALYLFFEELGQRKSPPNNISATTNKG